MYLKLYPITYLWRKKKIARTVLYGSEDFVFGSRRLVMGREKQSRGGIGMAR